MKMYNLYFVESLKYSHYELGLSSIIPLKNKWGKNACDIRKSIMTNIICQLSSIESFYELICPKQSCKPNYVIFLFDDVKM